MQGSIRDYVDRVLRQYVDQRPHLGELGRRLEIEPEVYAAAESFIQRYLEHMMDTIRVQHEQLYRGQPERVRVYLAAHVVNRADVTGAVAFNESTATVCVRAK